MHIEILVEDSSGKTLLDILLPKVLGPEGEPHTWRVIPYKGTGHTRPDLKSISDPAKRVLLDRLPPLLRGYGKTPGIDAVVAVLDADDKDCTVFLSDLKAIAVACNSVPNTMFWLAIEEMESWYLGDQDALLTAYPCAKRNIMKTYVQDSICKTWELLEIIIPNHKSADTNKNKAYPAGGMKHEWAKNIGPHMVPDRNISPSFGKLRDGLRRLLAESSEL